MPATLTASPDSPVKAGRGFGATPCDDLKSWPWDIIVTPQELILEAGEFVIASRLGTRRICRLTGRTRRLGSWLAMTIETFDVETVVRPLADGSPALWGIRGDRFPGTWAINSQALAD
jgi:hypothetical protein